MTHGIFEAQRLLRRINDRDPECARWLVQAIEQIALANANMPIKYALLQIHNALPNVALTDKEREFLCQQKSSASSTEVPPL